MSLNIDIVKVYEFMQPVSDALNQAYDYAVEFTDGFIGSMQNVLTVFGSLS